MRKQYEIRRLVDYIVANQISIADDMGDWVRLAAAFSTLGEEGRSMFHSVAAISTKYKRTENEKLFNRALCRKHNVTLGSFIYIAREHGIDTRAYLQAPWGEKSTGEYNCILAVENVAWSAPKQSAPTMPAQGWPSTTSNTSHTLPVELVRESFQHVAKSNLVRFLNGLFEKPRVTNVMEKYKVGATSDGWNIFWQVDEKNDVHAGKLMKYNEITGKRSRDGNGVGWMHRQLQADGRLPRDWHLSQCLFGLHLLKDDTRRDKTVCIVESEKTALVMALVTESSSALPHDRIYVATGGKDNFNATLLKPLEGWHCIAYPDSDGLKDWTRRALRLRKEVPGIDLNIDMRLNQHASSEEKLDIADMFINQVQEKHAVQTARAMYRMNPLLYDFLKKLDLVIEVL